MSTAHFNLTDVRGAALHGTPNLIFWILTVSLLPIAALFGGMAALVMALAVGLAVIVWTRPQEAPGAGVLFLFAAGALLPYGGRFDASTFGTEMYYWAAGLLIVTWAAVARIGVGHVFRILPASAKAFLAVGTVAAAYGWIQGAPLSYVFRQYYGVFLLIAYLGIALCVDGLELFLRRMASFGVFIVFCFFVYYAWIFSTYGFHKETGTINSQASLLAIVLFVAGIERAKRTWVIAAVALLLVPILLLDRGDVLTFLVALPVALGIMLKSQKARLLCCSTAILVGLPAMFPPIAQIVGRQLL